MAAVKWIKISTEIFDDEKIKVIDSLPDRDAIFTIWIKLLVLCGRINDGGKIQMNEAVPYTEEMLAAIFNRPVNTVRLALETFRNFKMVEMLPGDITFITNWEKHQSIEWMDRVREETRKRVAKYRASKKLLTGNVTVTGCNDTDLDLDLDLDLDKDKERKRRTSPAFAVDSMPYRMAKLIYDLHLGHDPKFLFGKNLEKTFQRWAKDIDKLNRLDGRDEAEIERIIRWCQAPGCFWIGNVLSGATLRKQFPTLVSQSGNIRETAEEKRLRLCREEMAKV